MTAALLANPIACAAHDSTSGDREQEGEGVFDAIFHVRMRHNAIELCGEPRRLRARL